MGTWFSWLMPVSHVDPLLSVSWCTRSRTTWLWHLGQWCHLAGAHKKELGTGKDREGSIDWLNMAELPFLPTRPVSNMFTWQWHESSHSLHVDSLNFEAIKGRRSFSCSLPGCKTVSVGISSHQLSETLRYDPCSRYRWLSWRWVAKQEDGIKLGIAASENKELRWITASNIMYHQLKTESSDNASRYQRFKAGVAGGFCCTLKYIYGIKCIQVKCMAHTGEVPSSTPVEQRHTGSQPAPTEAQWI